MDPFQPEEIGRSSKAADDAPENEVLAVGAELPIRNPGTGYSTGTGKALTNVTAANNTYIPVAAGGAGMKVDITAENGGVLKAVVSTAPSSDYKNGGEVTVAGGTGCVLLIPYK